ncbi:hypothetical protein PSYJA_05444, partial [Pseudomonas syringae pv. japonica str. M301072]
PGAYPRVLIEHVPDFLGLEPKRVNIHKSIGPVERRGGVIRTFTGSDGAACEHEVHVGQ